MAQQFKNSLVAQIGPIIEEAINEEFQKFYNYLIESGLSRKKIDRIFADYKKPKITTSTSKSTSEPMSTSKPKPKSFQRGKVVTLVKDYDENNHALVGDFDTTYKKFRDSFLKSKANREIYIYNTNLYVGSGWLIFKNSSDSNLHYNNAKKAFDDAGISYREIAREECEKEIREIRKDGPKEIDFSESEKEFDKGKEEEEEVLTKDDVLEYLEECNDPKVKEVCEALLKCKGDCIKKISLKKHISDKKNWRDIVKVGIDELEMCGYINVEEDGVYIYKLWMD